MAEPTVLVAGDTWSWTASYADYPASDGWTLAYSLTDATGAIAIAATASGADFSVSVAANTTKDYRAAPYLLSGRVTKGAELHLVYSAFCVVKPNPIGAALDSRTHARKVLDALESVIEGRATAGQIDLVVAAVGQRQSQWRPDTLLTWRDKYRAEVQAEAAADRASRGLGGGRVVVRL